MYFLFFFCLIFFSLGYTARASAKEFFEDCVTIGEAKVCVGESYDDAMARLDHKFAVGQRTLPCSAGMRFEYTYSYDGMRMVLCFEQTVHMGPYILVEIER